MEDEEYKKLPVDERCVHKLWKARLGAYEELAKLYRQIDNDKSPEFGKYLGLVKKFVIDSNATCQEKGLEATLAYIENYAHAGKTVSEVMSGVVLKAIAAPKTKTREMALQITLMYIEIEKYEAVEEELVKGMDQKNPKIVAACINACTTALKEFGSKIINVKPLVKKITPLFADRDKTVRDEARLMVIEMYKWIGAALKSQLANLQPVQLTELETEFAKLEGHKSIPNRYIRSQQHKQRTQSAENEIAEGGASDEGEDDADSPETIDAYDLASPVDVLSKLPKDFYEKIELKKWQERKEALDILENLLKTPKLENGDYGDLVRALRKIVQKDSNVVVVALAGRCIALLATGLKKRFQTYAGCCVSPLLEKFKEKKQNVLLAIRDAIDAVYLTTTIEAILEDVIEVLGNKNPSVKSETAQFLSRAFTKTVPTAINKKTLKSLIVPLLKNINEPDPGVRDASAETIGTLMKLMGEKTVAPFLVDLEKDALKMAKIKECCDKAVITVKTTVKKERPTTAPAKTTNKAVKPSGAPAAKSAPNTARPSKAPKKKAPISPITDYASGPDEEETEEGVNSQDSVVRVDISGQIAEALIAEIDDKNWKVRNEALGKVTAILQEAKFIRPNLGDLPQALVHRLGDSNTKIAQTALNICEAIAKAMGPPCKQYVKVFFPCFLQNLGDNKSWMRAAAVDAINAYSDQCGYKEFFENEMIGDALKSGSPVLRIELWQWLADKLPKIGAKSIPREELTICVPHLYSNLEDRNADVRKNAQEAILGIMIHVGYENMLKQTEKLKPGSKSVVVAALEKTRPLLPMKPLPTKTAKAGSDKEEKAVRGTKAVASSKTAVKSKGSAGSTKATPSTGGGGGGRKKDDDVDLSPLLVINNMKHQRTIDESKLKVLRWNFTTPREEFVELLKDQMGAANVNRTLISNMFHSDFRYHIKAIEMLTEDLPTNSPALMANLDLILKWMTLRFFDTNPSVLLKGLEYLNSVFAILLATKYHMLESEASSFLPYLVLKMGDPKDSVRNGVRSLLNQISEVYPISRLFTYVMDGLKSKNARQRAECLEVMAAFIYDFGIVICSPSAGACLKEVAKQISDRDNSVRNAALNCVTHAYNIVGEKVYKMVGHISDKDMSLLEERIKRASKKMLAKPPRQESTSQMVPPNNNIPQIEDANGNGDNDVEDEEEEQDLPPMIMPPQAIQEVNEVLGPFRLDPDLLRELDTFPEIPTIELKEINLDFLNEEIRIPTLSEEDKKIAMMPLSPPKPIDINMTFLRVQKPTAPKNKDPVLGKNILDMGSGDRDRAAQGLTEVANFLQANKNGLTSAMVDYQDEFFASVTAQLRYFRHQDPVADSRVAKQYRNLLMVIDAFYLNKYLGSRVSVRELENVLRELINILVENKFERCANGDAYIRIINLHVTKIMEKSDHTRIICALIRLMHECLKEEYSARHTDLVMKCIWRILKMMPTWRADAIDFDDVLLDIHNFLKEFPSSWWKNKPLDTALRTIKTIMHCSCKLKGGSIMLHLGKIPNTGESEVESYILKLLKTLKIEEVKQMPVKADSQRRSLSRANHNILTDIFQKIGSKDETKEGLTLLYDFMEQHPEADIEPFLKKSSKFFQDYIQNGLREIEESRKARAPSTEELSLPIDGDDIKGPEYWQAKLDAFLIKLDSNSVDLTNDY